MIARGDSKRGVEVVHSSKDSSIGVQRRRGRPKEAQDRDNDDEKDIQPIEMLVPVPPRDGHLTDMRRLARHFAKTVAVGS